MLRSRAPAQPASSAMTEWSITKSQGICGLIFAGSPPREAHASRMTAKSTNTGTPVKSWNSTRAGENSISLPTSPALPAATMRPASSSAACSSRTLRSTFSSSTVSAYGSASDPGTAETG